MATRKRHASLFDQMGISSTFGLFNRYIVGHFDVVDDAETLELIKVRIAHFEKVRSQTSHGSLAHLGDEKSHDGAQRVQDDALERVYDELAIAALVVALVSAARLGHEELDEQDGYYASARSVEASKPQGYCVR